MWINIHVSLSCWGIGKFFVFTSTCISFSVMLTILSYLFLSDFLLVLTVRASSSSLPPEVNRLFNEFCSSLQDCYHGNSLLTLTTAHTLAIAIMDEIIEFNWMIRDCFKEWKKCNKERDGWTTFSTNTCCNCCCTSSCLVTFFLWLVGLTSAIRSHSAEYYLDQIVDLDHLAGMSVRLLKPLTVMLQSLVHSSTFFEFQLFIHNFFYINFANARIVFKARTGQTFEQNDVIYNIYRSYIFAMLLHMKRFFLVHCMLCVSICFVLSFNFVNNKLSCFSSNK